MSLAPVGGPPSPSPEAASTRVEAPEFVAPASTLIVLPWLDPVVERIGHDARSTYVELYWLGTLGPTATWLLRRLNAALDDHPDGVEIDMADTARALGLNYQPNPSNPFVKALHRCQIFGLAQQLGDAVAVRRRIPPLPRRHLAKLPQAMQDVHDAWAATAGSST